MAPQYKLLYFGIKAIGEPIRFLFHYGNIEFEDYRYSQEEWDKVRKPASPFGQGPLLEVNGKVYWQHVAIQRHVANLVGLRGHDPWEDLEIDMVAETIYDLRCTLYNWYFDKTENKGRREKEILEETVPFILQRLDKKVADNQGHFVNGKLTWPDLQFTSMFEYLSNMRGKPVDQEYPNLQALRAKVLEIPQIKAWVAKRPVSEW